MFAFYLLIPTAEVEKIKRKKRDREMEVINSMQFRNISVGI